MSKVVSGIFGKIFKGIVGAGNSGGVAKGKFAYQTGLKTLTEVAFQGKSGKGFGGINDVFGGLAQGKGSQLQLQLYVLL